MAVTDIHSNNKLIKFTQQINREWVRENMFCPTWAMISTPSFAAAWN